MVRWALLTGEYPPDPGGVSDYTRQLAVELARRGERVDVWAPGARTDEWDGQAGVHRRPGLFSPGGLTRLSGELRARSGPWRLLVQYVPHAFGWRGMNVALATWLSGRPASELWVMFHEVAFPLEPGQPLAHRVLGAVTAQMARVIATRADRLLVSTSAWEPRLRELGIDAEVHWLPIPSNMPLVRTRPLPRRSSGQWIAHLGTYGAPIVPLLEGALPALLTRDPARRALLLGRGSDRFAERLAKRFPALADRLQPIPDAAPEVIADQLCGCDLALQPFPDGITTRRTSAMAPLALGVPVVSNRGALTEPGWEGCALAPAPDPELLASTTEDLLGDVDRREALGSAGKTLYRTRFSLERIVDTLLSG